LTGRDVAALDISARPEDLLGGTAVPTDPQLSSFLELMSGMPPLHETPIELLRANTLPQGEPTPIASIENRSIPGPGGPLPVRIYRPREGVLPLLVYYHGGGWVVGDLDSHDSVCRDLALAGDCVVMAVDYRLSPEHRFPAAPDDCLAALRWAAGHAAELGIDASRIVVAGDSAGGNLATVTAMRARDEGGPGLAGQLLIYPVTAHYNPATPSMIENAEGYFLTRDAMIFFIDQYLADPSHAAHPHFAVIGAPDLSRLPPAYVITAQYDPLRDEGEAYAARLGEAGVKVQHHRYDGMIHGFFGLAGVDRSAEAVKKSGTWLRMVFGAA
jgi:acetyl esterase